MNRQDNQYKKGEMAVGIMVISGLILMLLAGSLVTQYLRTQAVPPEQSIQKDFTFTVPDDPNLIGNHSIKFTVTDGIDTFTSDPVTVVVTAKNQAPIVSAGDDVSVRLPLEATLSGTVSDDGLPNVPGEVTTVWSKTSGPGDVAFADAGALETTASFSAAGTYVLRLTADDGQDSAYDELMATVEAAPPAPDLSLSSNRSFVALNDTIVVRVHLAQATPFANWAQYLSFDGSKVELIDQQAGDYATFIADTRGLPTINSSGEVRAGGFSLSNSNSGDGNLGIFTFKAVGTGTTTITTANKSGSNPFGNVLSEADGYEIIPDIVGGEINLTILSGNSRPSVNAGADQEIQLPTNVVNLDGTVSDDGLPDPPGATTITWSKVSGPGSVVFSNANAEDTSATFSEAGTYVLRLTADDGEFTTADDVQVTVLAENVAPVGVDDTYDAVAGEPLTVDAPGVLSNDSDANGDNITARLLTSPQFGDLTLEASGSFTYLANDNYSGIDSFTYEVFDGTLASDPVTVTFNVTIRNIAPAVSAGNNIVVNLPGVANLDGTVSDDGLPDPPGTFTTIWSKVAGPGNVTFGNSSAVDTTATFDEAGTYVLRLSANDGELTASDETTITVNTLPVGRDDAYNAWQGETLTVDAPGVLSNDSDADNDNLTAILVNDVQHGELALSADGSFEYISDATFRGTDSFTYQVFDGKGNSEETTVEITVAVRNVAPTVSAGDDQVVNLPNPAILQGSVSDDGEPQGAALSVLWSKVSGPGAVVFADSSSAATSATFSVAGDYVLRLLANDGELTSYDDILISVNTPPQGQDDSYEVFRAELLEVEAPGVLANDVEEDNGDTLTAQLVDDVAHGDLNLATDGSFTYTSDQFYDGTDSFTYVASDGQASSEIVTVEIVVGVRNRAPEVSAGEDVTVEFGNEVQLSGVATDDGNPEDPGELAVLWSKISGPGEVAFGAINTAQTAASFSQTGQYVLRLSANDGEFMTADEVTVVVHTAPEVSAGEDVTLLINEEDNLTGVVSDDGLPDPPGALTAEWSIVSGPENGLIINDVNDPASGITATEAGTYVLRLTVTDGNLTTTSDVTITAVERYAEIEIPGQTRITLRPGMTVEVPFIVRTNIIGVGRLLIEMTQDVYQSIIE